MTQKQKEKFSRLVHGLNNLILEIRAGGDLDAQFYLEDGSNFYILSGCSHDGEGTARQDRELTCEQLIYADCGGW